LWSGQLPLGRAFWEFGIVYGFLVNFMTTLLFLAILTTDAPTAVAIAAQLLPIPYNLLVLVGVWRSAERYRGARQRADLARAAIVLWTLAASLT
jgi:hypothetical protein